MAKVSSGRSVVHVLTSSLQSIIVRAQGEARSAELIGEAVRQNKGFLQLRRLEAARDIATLLAASDNRVMLDSQSLLLNGECLGRDRGWQRADRTCSGGRREGLALAQKVIPSPSCLRCVAPACMVHRCYYLRSPSRAAEPQGLTARSLPPLLPLRRDRLRIAC